MLLKLSLIYFSDALVRSLSFSTSLSQYTFNNFELLKTRSRGGECSDTMLVIRARILGGSRNSIKRRSLCKSWAYLEIVAFKLLANLLFFFCLLLLCLLSFNHSNYVKYTSFEAFFFSFNFVIWLINLTSPDLSGLFEFGKFQRKKFYSSSFHKVLTW